MKKTNRNTDESTVFNVVPTYRIVEQLELNGQMGQMESVDGEDFKGWYLTTVDDKVQQDEQIDPFSTTKVSCFRSQANWVQCGKQGNINSYSKAMLNICHSKFGFKFGLFYTFYSYFWILLLQKMALKNILPRSKNQTKHAFVSSLTSNNGNIENL